MRRILLAVLCLYSFISTGQIRPAENDTLNYRMVGFSIPVQSKTDQYLFEIANGRINNNYDFQKLVFFFKKQTETRFITVVPAFGKDYTWRVTYLNGKNKEKGRSQLYHFTTGDAPFLDTNASRLRIITPAEKHKDVLVFLDNPAALYNTDGEALWYLPQLPGMAADNRSLRDLKVNESGTITCLTEKGAYEVDYDGNVLWVAPDNGKVSGDSTERYHHQFDKLSNGHYMVPGNKTVQVELDPKQLTEVAKDPEVKLKDGKYFKNTALGTLIEYDSTGKVVWHWLSSDFFTRIEPINTAFIRSEANEVNTNIHMNGFYFNEKDSTIYVSYKNISRILKIKYPTGEVLANYYGMPYQNRSGRSTASESDLNLFSYQHNCQLAPDGSLYLFNNNMVRGMRGVSYVSMFREPEVEGAPLTKTWEFSCDIDGQTNAGAGVGGSVYMLHDGSIIACAGTAGRVFIVSRDKNILWNALPETFTDGTWRALRQYKASVIEDKQLVEKLIFR